MATLQDEKANFIEMDQADSSFYAANANSIPPLQRLRFRDIFFGDQEEERVQVKYFSNEQSFKERLQLYFVKNRRSSLRIRLFNVFIKIFSCLLYIVRVAYDHNFQQNDCVVDCADVNATKELIEQMSEEQYIVHPLVSYQPLIWVDRSLSLWVLQVVVAFISVAETALVMYISYKGNFLQLLRSPTIFLELLASVPFIVSAFVAIFVPVPYLQHLFVPVFFNCWLAKFALEHMLNDLNRVMQRSQTALSQQIMLLCSTLVCLIFTSSCAVQHAQRGGRRDMTLFQSLYFVIVTFSTVGYGEFYPDNHLSQGVVIVMICVAFLVIPSQLEQLAYTWMERQKSGGEYSQHRARSEKHVVLCVAHLNADTIMDFLNEFYAHPRLQDFYVILLTPSEIDSKMRLLLQVPLWADRVIFIKGSVMKDTDLERARMAEAEAAFILAGRNYTDKAVADQETILRSWAVKDYAPQTPQYVQIFRPESKMHVKHADYVVCEDEFKYALLASNCLCPGISTFITLVLHTSRGEEGQHSTEPWHKIYGKHSGNEIYHIRLGQSKFFGEYEGKSFTYASFHAHRKYGVGLVAVQKDRAGSTIQLNPGPKHIMKGNDICYYMSITKEEHSSFVANNHDHHGDSQTSKVATTIAGIGSLALEMQHTRAQPASQVISKYPSVASKLRKKHGTMKMKEIVEEDANMLAVHSVTRKPSIESTGSESSVTSESSLLLREILADSVIPSPVPDGIGADKSEVEENDGESVSDIDDSTCSKCGLICVVNQYTKGFPPVSPYIGTSATLCFLLKEKKPLCCLELCKTCEHCSFRNANEYGWKRKAIILVADHASNGLYNFIIPLRAHYQPAHGLYPIVLLLQQQPDAAFLDAVSWFPMIYWMSGSIEWCISHLESHVTHVHYNVVGQSFSLDDILKAGIVLADHAVVVNKEDNCGAGNRQISGKEGYLADSNTIVSVQTIYRLFPSVRIITELSHSTNMRFMQFNAKDLYALHQSKVEKKERRRGSHIAYMFRLPFAAGNVFSANMLDTLLYQAFVKDYLIQFVRLLLGIDQAVGSGYLSSMELTQQDMWIRTYGRLYQKLCSADAFVPIGIYRTQQMDSSVISNQWQMRQTVHMQSLHHRMSMIPVSLELEKQQRWSAESEADDLWKRTYSCKYLLSEKHEISNLVRCRMDNLNLPSEDYSTYASDKRGTISYVILNPSFDLKLELGDIIYVIKPSLPILRGSKPSTPRRRRKKPSSRNPSPDSNCVQDQSAEPSGTEQSLPLLTVTTPRQTVTKPDAPSVSFNFKSNGEIGSFDKQNGDFPASLGSESISGRPDQLKQ